MQLSSNTYLQNGKYKIIKVLGQGGFGITYLASETSIDRKVAIKEFFHKDSCRRHSDNLSVEHFAANDSGQTNQLMSKFKKEAMVLSKLSHKNIVKIFDIFEENRTVYYVMEYIDGMSLKDLVDLNGNLKEGDALSYIKQVASALSYLHENKINHLDIKPANIMKNKSDGRVYLIDFGVSKQYDVKTLEGTTLTPVGLSVGYSPFEQYQMNGVQTFSPQSDVYSLAATLYKLLTGITPPEASLLIEEGLPIEELLNRKISYSVIAAIKNAMKAKKVRTQSVNAFVSELERPYVSNEETIILDQNEETILVANNPSVSNAVNDPQGQVMTPKKSKTWMWIVVVGFILIASVISTYLFNSGGGAPIEKEIGQNYDPTRTDINYIRNFANKNNPEAQFQLGICYQQGNQVSPSDEKAFNWFLKSAQLGNVDAQRKVSECYAIGKGTPKNNQKSKEWAKRANESVNSVQGNLDEFMNN